MTFPFLFDDAEDIAHLKKRRAEYVTNLEIRTRRANMAAPPPLIRQCIMAQEKAALDIQDAQLNLDKQERLRHAWDIEAHEAEAEMIARQQMAEHRGKNTAEILRLIEDRTRAAMLEQQGMTQLALEGEAAVAISIQGTQQARERTLFHILRQYAGEQSINNMKALNGWAWRHLAQDVNAAMSPHVRDELGRTRYYFVREQRAVRARSRTEDLPAAPVEPNNEAPNAPQPPVFPSKRMGR